ncbi:MAG: hypothetical protein ACOYL3_25550 [Desulfuromonadaceae bacterium]
MLTIKVNGQEEKVRIGCRTSVNLDVLLKILESDATQVTLNGKTIASSEFENTTVNSGDSLLLK